MRGLAEPKRGPEGNKKVHKGILSGTHFVHFLGALGVHARAFRDPGPEDHKKVHKATFSGTCFVHFLGGILGARTGFR